MPRNIRIWLMLTYLYVHSMYSFQLFVHGVVDASCCPSYPYPAAQGTTIKPLVRLIHLRLARTRKETLNESVHTAVSSTATNVYVLYILRHFHMFCALYVHCELGNLSLSSEKLLSQGVSDQIRACFVPVHCFHYPHDRGESPYLVSRCYLYTNLTELHSLQYPDQMPCIHSCASSCCPNVDSHMYHIPLQSCHSHHGILPV